ncbi:MAG: transcription termination factor Rho [Acidimicrobiales bacterium]
MVPQPPLERSVLERKERDELATIAAAMGVKPSARASKSTLIDHILREAGIETAPEEKPARRPRVSKAAAAAAAAAARAGNGAEQAAPSLDGSAQSETSPAEAATPQPAPPGDNAVGGQPPAAVVEAIADAPAAVAGPPTFNGTATVDVHTDTEPEAASEGAEQHPGNGNNAADTQPVDAGPRTDERPRDGGPRPDHRPGGGQQPFDANDPANRRGRRRRGRERGERDVAPERGGQPDPQYQGEPIPVEGLLDLREEGFGFLRTNGYLASQHDVYVSLSQVRRFGLRKGDTIKGASRPAGSSEKYPALLRIDTVSGMTADEARQRPRFEDLTPLFPDEKLRLEVPGEPANMVARIVDLVSPIGKGQRGLIVSPPKAGKTTVLKQIAHSIEVNNPEVHLMVLLVDERPEEVTDMRRSVKGEVIASTFDRPSDEHTQVAELASERAKRLVEMGKDVVIVLDGITRLARAYNLAAPTTGRIMSGGLATEALYPPKKFFGSARNLEEGGSLTILATALIETGSKMDEVIFEEFKGTGNMELRLDRRLAERRIYPALEVNASSTRHEELLFPPDQLHQVWKLRRVLNALEPGAGLELLMDKIKHTKSNDEFLSEIAKAPS